MSFWDRFKRKPPIITEDRAEKIVEKRRMQISEAMREKLNAMAEARESSSARLMPVPADWSLHAYIPPKGVCPDTTVLAMDAVLASSGVNYALMTGSGFPGFPYLIELSQITEYRDMSERMAAEMTRKWVKHRTVDEVDRTKEIAEIEAEYRRLHVRDLFRRAAELDGYFGRGQIFIDLGADNGPELTKPLLLDKIKIKQGSLRSLKVIEPVNTYPQRYNSTNPLADDYYAPSAWFVQNGEVHTSRLLTFISRPVPNYLKPAYNFSGMSLSQLAQPYVDYWLSTRESVGKLLKNFSTSILKTNMSDILTGGSSDTLVTRAKMFTKFRDNQGLFLMDKDSEEFQQVNTPLAGLSQLQAQAQEHMASVAKTPLVILLGISPTGLNASSDGEIRVFYDFVAEQQEKLFRANLEAILKLVQLNLYGKIYDDITFDFVELYTMTGRELAMIRASDAQAGAAFIGAGVIEAAEERTRLASDPQSGYNSLDANKKIKPPAAPPKEGQTPGQEGSSPGGIKIPGLGGGSGHDAMPTFFGNQHTGSLGTMDDSAHTVAVMASSVALNGSNTAISSGTKRDNERALQAHKRALRLHREALEEDLYTPVHEEYVKTHKRMIREHESTIRQLQAKIDSWKDGEDA